MAGEGDETEGGSVPAAPGPAPAMPAPPPEWRPYVRGDFWQHNRPSRRRTFFLVLAIVVVVALWSTGAVFAITQLVDTSSDSEDARGGEWDPEIEPYVRFVEDVQGAEFTEPVDVEFLSDDEFAELFTGDGDSDSIDILNENIEDILGLWRALGLSDLSTDTDPGEGPSVSSEALRGLYLAPLETVFLRESETGVVRELRLVHELTHALDDQRFDWLERARSIETLAEASVVRSIQEGNATRSERRYFEQLEPDEQETFREHERSVGTVPGTADGSLAFLEASSAMPYALGYVYIEALVAVHGPTALDQVYDITPSQLALFSPSQALDRKDTSVASIPLEDGEEEIETTAEIDLLSLYLMLAGRIEPVAALRAADAWRGNSYRIFRRDGFECVRIAVVGADADGAASIQGALELWAESMPDGAATIEAGRGPDEVVLTTCDPGRAATPPDRSAAEMLALVLVRNAATVRLVDEGSDVTAAECAANAVLLDEARAAEAVDELTSESSMTINEMVDDLEAEFAAVLAGC